MTEIALSRKERAGLLDLLAQTSDTRLLRRTYSLLWFDEGESVLEIAEQLQVSRRAVYYWLDRFLERADLPLVDRLSDAERSGRPVTVQGIIEPLLDAIIDTDPRTQGYRSTVWTAPLLARYLADYHQLSASVPSVRLALARLKIDWKRPRHRLALRPDTWRQVKGG
jgi:transposase